MKTKLTKKDLIVWGIAIVAFIPVLLVFSESDTIVPNLIGFAYIGLLSMACRTKIGRLFIERLLSIDEKLFKA